MAYSTPIEPAIQALKDLMIDSFDLPSGSVVIESGGQVFALDQLSLPAALLELDGEPDLKFGDSERGGSALTLTHTLSYYCWLFTPTVSNTDDLATLRSKLFPLLNALMNDRNLNNTVTHLDPMPYNWTDNGRSWPIEGNPGGGVIAGYVGVTMTIGDR